MRQEEITYQLHALVATISERVACYLERRGRPARGARLVASPDSHGTSCGAQSAHHLRGPLPLEEDDFGTDQLGRIARSTMPSLSI